MGSAADREHEDELQRLRVKLAGLEVSRAESFKLSRTQRSVLEEEVRRLSAQCERSKKRLARFCEGGRDISIESETHGQDPEETPSLSLSSVSSEVTDEVVDDPIFSRRLHEEKEVWHCARV